MIIFEVVKLINVFENKHFLCFNIEIVAIHWLFAGIYIV